MFAKKILFCSCLMLMAGCSNKPAASTPAPVEPLDLTGTWVSEASDEGAYTEAVITDDSIEINWITDEANALYWAGSYEAPAKPGNSYSWTSKGDTKRMQASILASSEETKDFTYKDGVIKYKSAMMGVTKTVELEKKD